MHPAISVITPSFRQLSWLKLCAASIADQRDVAVEHLVQDAGTGPEMEAWAATQPDVKLLMEKDAGMYDAVNRGLRRASGEILCYLNCDEQYLPGALSRVAEFFQQHPETDVAFAHAIVVDAEGKFISYRKSVLPQSMHTRVSENLAILTCATFFRRRILEQHEFFFNPQLKDVGDAEWVLRLIEKKVPMRVLPIFTSTFAETGENRNLAPTALREKAELLANAPAWARKLRSAIIAHYRFRKLLGGAYRQAPFDYEIYTHASPAERTRFHVAHPTSRWRR